MPPSMFPSGLLPPLRVILAERIIGLNLSFGLAARALGLSWNSIVLAELAKRLSSVVVRCFRPADPLTYRSFLSELNVVGCWCFPRRSCASYLILSMKRVSLIPNLSISKWWRAVRWWWIVRYFPMRLAWGLLSVLDTSSDFYSNIPSGGLPIRFSWKPGLSLPSLTSPWPCPSAWCSECMGCFIYYSPLAISPPTEFTILRCLRWSTFPCDSGPKLARYDSLMVRSEIKSFSCCWLVIARPSLVKSAVGESLTTPSFLS